MNDKHTIITLFRANKNDETRTNNLKYFLSYYKSLCNNIVVIEQDAKPSTEKLVTDYGYYYLFAYNEYLFNRSWGFNIGANVAKQKSLPENYLFIDCDIILSKESIEKSICLLRNNDICSCKPYNRIYHISAHDTQRIFNSDNDSDCFKTIANAKSSNHVMYAGGALFIKRDIFYGIGGWLESFEGWGGEDQELGGVLMSKYYPTSCIMVDGKDYPCIHLYHSSGISCEKNAHEKYKSNVDILKKLSQVTVIDEYIKERKSVINGKMLKYRWKK